MRALTRRAVVGGGGAAGVMKAFAADGPPRFTTKAMRQNASVRDVDTLLVLATDVSNSVIKERWEVQRSGYAAAFANEDVQKALLSGARGAIGLCLVQWSSYDQQEHVVPWTYLDSREMIGVFSLLLKGMERQFSSNTGIGAALRYCANYLDEAPYRAERAVIDISGDGHDNQPIVIGDRVVPLPQIRDSIVARGIIINGMPILGVAEPLPRYKSRVLCGGGHRRQRQLCRAGRKPGRYRELRGGTAAQAGCRGGMRSGAREMISARDQVGSMSEPTPELPRIS
jgi:hypothetical protein